MTKKIGVCKICNNGEEVELVSYRGVTVCKTDLILLDAQAKAGNTELSQEDFEAEIVKLQKKLKKQF